MLAALSERDRVPAGDPSAWVRVLSADTARIVDAARAEPDRTAAVR